MPFRFIRTYLHAHLRFLFIARWKWSSTGLFFSCARVCTVATQGLYTHQKQNFSVYESISCRCALKQFLRDCVDRESSFTFLNHISRKISSLLPCSIGIFFTKRKAETDCIRSKHLCFKRSEEEKILFPLSSKIKFIIIGKSAFLNLYLFLKFLW